MRHLSSGPPHFFVEAPHAACGTPPVFGEASRCECQAPNGFGGMPHFSGGTPCFRSGARPVFGGTPRSTCGARCRFMRAPRVRCGTRCVSCRTRKGHSVVRVSDACHHRPMKRLLPLAALAALLPCGCARSADPPRTEPTAASPVAEAVPEPLSAAEEAAQAAERHADAVERAANGGKEPGPILPTPPKPPSAGPELTLEQLRSRMVRLALGPAQGVDDEVEHVAKVMGVPLQPWREGWLTESGHLRDGGSYRIELEPSTHEEPIRELSIYIGMDDWQGDPAANSRLVAKCALPLAPIKEQLVAAGYAGWKSKPPGPQSWGFNRDPSSNALISHLTFITYREHPISVTSRECVSRIHIAIPKTEG